jgi:uncharacterized SAM-binding protein YcdF (DUF218 family)
MILLPPLNGLLIAAAGAFLMLRRRRLGFTLMLSGLLALYLLSTPLIGAALRSRLEARASALDFRAQQAQAIVILGGGCIREAPEFGGDTVGRDTLERLRWGARLHKQTGLPILTTGGKTFGLSRSEGDLMSDSLKEDFGVATRWVESESLTTMENAMGSQKMLAAAGIRRIILVTHASHMQRAVMAFRGAGFDVIPAPTSYRSLQEVNVLSFVASIDGLRDSWIYFHESLGMLWYRLRFGAGSLATW